MITTRRARLLWLHARRSQVLSAHADSARTLERSQRREAGVGAQAAPAAGAGDRLPLRVAGVAPGGRRGPSRPSHACEEADRV